MKKGVSNFAAVGLVMALLAGCVSSTDSKSLFALSISCQELVESYESGNPIINEDTSCKHFIDGMLVSEIHNAHIIHAAWHSAEINGNNEDIIKPTIDYLKSKSCLASAFNNAGKTSENFNDLVRGYEKIYYKSALFLSQIEPNKTGNTTEEARYHKYKSMIYVYGMIMSYMDFCRFLEKESKGTHSD